MSAAGPQSILFWVLVAVGASGVAGTATVAEDDLEPPPPAPGLPAFIVAGCVGAFVALSLGYGVLRYAQLRLKGEQASFFGPVQLWILILTRAPWLVLLLGVGVPAGLSFSAIQAANYNFEIDTDLENYMRSDTEAAKLEEAVSFAVDEQSLYCRDSPGRRLQATFPQQTARYWDLELFYQAKDGGNVFTPEALDEIQQFENDIVSFQDWEQVCRRSRPGAGEALGDCITPNSVLTLFDASYMEEGYRWRTPTEEAIDLALLALLREGITWWTDIDFRAGNLASVYTRSTFFGGLPIAGETAKIQTVRVDGSVVLDDSTAEPLHKKWLEKLYDEVLDEANDGRYKHVVISWSETRFLQDYELMESLFHDVKWSAGSFIFVIGFLCLRLRSLFLVVGALAGVLLSFTTTYYFYSWAQFGAMSMVNFLSLFLIVGVAADDVLVLHHMYVDARITPLTKDSQQEDGDEEPCSPTFVARRIPINSPAEAMQRAYVPAGVSMLLTTTTTSGSFFSLILSPLYIVRGFGFFMGTVVVLNYISVMTTFAASIVLKDLVMDRCCKCCSRGSKKPAGAGKRTPPTPSDANGESNAAATPDSPKVVSYAPTAAATAAAAAQLPAAVTSAAAGPGPAAAPLATPRSPAPPSSPGSPWSSPWTPSRRMGPTGSTAASTEAAKARSKGNILHRFLWINMPKFLVGFRCVLIPLLLVLAGLGAWRTVEDLELAGGEPQIFGEDRNAGRVALLLADIFPSYSNSDLQNAQRATDNVAAGLVTSTTTTFTIPLFTNTGTTTTGTTTTRTTTTRTTETISTLTTTTATVTRAGTTAAEATTVAASTAAPEVATQTSTGVSTLGQSDLDTTSAAALQTSMTAGGGPTESASSTTAAASPGTAASERLPTTPDAGGQPSTSVADVTQLTTAGVGGQPSTSAVADATTLEVGGQLTTSEAIARVSTTEAAQSQPGTSAGPAGTTAGAGGTEQAGTAPSGTQAVVEATTQVAGPTSPATTIVSSIAQDAATTPAAGTSAASATTTAAASGPTTAEPSTTATTVTTTATGTTATTTATGTTSTTATTTSSQITVPGAPVIQEVVVSGDRQLSVSLSPPATGDAVVLYTCTSEEDEEVSASSSDAVVVFSGLTAGTSYSFTCVASSSAGDSARSAASGPATAITGPEAPVIEEVRVSGNGELTVQVAAIAAANATVAPVDDVSCSAVEQPLTSSAVAGAGVVFRNLVAGEAYSFRCSAKNQVGTSGLSGASPAATALFAPYAPEVLCIQPRDQSLVVQVREATPQGDTRFDPVEAVECYATSAPDALFAATGESPSSGLEATITGLTNLLPVSVVCRSTSTAGLVAESPASVLVSPGVQVVSAMTLEGDDVVLLLFQDPEVFRVQLANELGVPVSAVVMDISYEGQDFQDCLLPSAARRRLSVSLVPITSATILWKVVLPDGTQPEDLDSTLAAVGAGLQQQLGVDVTIEEPILAVGPNIDSSLQSLSLDPVTDMAPVFDPTVLSYNATAGDVSVVFTALPRSPTVRSVQVGDVVTSAQGTATVVLAQARPATNTVVIKVTAADYTSTVYIVELGKDAVECSGDCNGGKGECDELRGTCTNCDEGYGGPDCGSYCPQDHSCSGAGRCSSALEGCDCDETYTGEYCTVRVCPVCNNNGTCVQGAQTLDADWRCDCGPDYRGENCQWLACPGDCSDAGDCNGNTGVCSCFAGYQGEDCGVAPEALYPLENTVELALVWGISGYTSEDKPVYDTAFDFARPEVQEWIRSVCRQAQADSTLKVREEVDCWPDEFANYSVLQGWGYPVPEEDLEAAFNSFFSLSSRAREHEGDLGRETAGCSEDLIYLRVRLRINVPEFEESRLLEEEYNLWSDFVEVTNRDAPVGARMIMVSRTWSRVMLELSVFRSTLLAFATSATVCLVVVLVFTRNLILSVMTLLTFVMAIAFLFFFVVSALGWEFGAIQAIGLTTFVGLGTDYLLHICHGYYASKVEGSVERAIDCMQNIGPAVLGGAVTTAGASIFLIPCWIYLFEQLGVMLCINTVVSILLTFFFLVPILSLFGPATREGDLLDILRCRCLLPASRGRSPKPIEHGAAPGDKGSGCVAAAAVEGTPVAYAPGTAGCAVGEAKSTSDWRLFEAPADPQRPPTPPPRPAARFGLPGGSDSRRAASAQAGVTAFPELTVDDEPARV